MQGATKQKLMGSGDGASMSFHDRAGEFDREACTREKSPLPLGCSVVSLGELWKVMDCSGGKAVVPFLFVWSVSNILIYAAFIPFKYKSIRCCISRGQRARAGQCAAKMSSFPRVPLAGLEGCSSQAPRDCRRAQAFPESCAESPVKPRRGFPCVLTLPRSWAAAAARNQPHACPAAPLGAKLAPDMGTNRSSQSLLGSLGRLQQLRSGQQCLLTAQKPTVSWAHPQRGQQGRGDSAPLR